jgi:Fe-S-cluster containining protein
VAATADKQIHVFDLTAGSKAAEFKSPLAYQTKCLAIFSDKCERQAVRPSQYHTYPLFFLSLCAQQGLRGGQHRGPRGAGVL